MQHTCCVVNCHAPGTCSVALASHRSHVHKVCFFSNYMSFFLQEYSAEMCLLVHTECFPCGMTHKSQQTFCLCFLSSVTRGLQGYAYELALIIWDRGLVMNAQVTRWKRHSSEFIYSDKDKYDFMSFKTSFLLKFTYQGTDGQWMEYHPPKFLNVCKALVSWF